MTTLSRSANALLLGVAAPPALLIVLLVATICISAIRRSQIPRRAHVVDSATIEFESWIGGGTVACIRSIDDRHVCEVDGCDPAEVVLFNDGSATTDASVALRRSKRDVDARLAPDVRRR